MFFKFDLKRAIRAVLLLAVGSTLTLGSTSALADDSFTQKLMGRAMDLVGVKYRYGGTSPTTGLDCSGYVQYVFQNAVGVSLPRVASAQSHVGEHISSATDVKAGDMVFFNTRGFAFSHVGISIGNGMFIHSPKTGSSVRIDSMNNSYWRSHYNGARRVSGAGRGSSFASNAPQSM